jgi:phosphate uptake regulator
LKIRKDEEEMGFDNARDCLGYRVVVKNVERLGDHAVRLSQDVLDYKTPIQGKNFDRIQEMSNYAISVMDDACLALFKKDYDQAEKSIGSANNIQKYEKRILGNLKIRKDEEEMGFDNARDCLGYRVVVKNVERLGDHAVRLSQDVLDYKTPIQGKNFDRIQEMSNYAISVMDDACLALFKKGYDQAEKSIESANNIQKYEKRILGNLKIRKDEEEMFRIRKIVENVKRVAEYASDIGEIVLNTNIEKILKKSEM